MASVHLKFCQTRSGFSNLCFSMWSSQSSHFGNILDIMIFYEGLVSRCSVMDESQTLRSYYNHIPAPNPWKRTLLLIKAEPALFIGTNAQSRRLHCFYYFGWNTTFCLYVHISVFCILLCPSVIGVLCICSFIYIYMYVFIDIWN